MCEDVTFAKAPLGRAVEAEEIKHAYHEKLREYHPDKRPNSKEGRGKKITAALKLGKHALRGYTNQTALAPPALLAKESRMGNPQR